VRALRASALLSNIGGNKAARLVEAPTYAKGMNRGEASV